MESGSKRARNGSKTLAEDFLGGFAKETKRERDGNRNSIFIFLFFSFFWLAGKYWAQKKIHGWCYQSSLNVFKF